MKPSLFLILTVFCLFMYNCGQKRLNYPHARKGDTIDVYFGTAVADPYRWLEDPESDETRTWIKAENNLTSDYLSQIPFRSKIRDRLTKVYNYPKMDTPFKKAGRYFYSRNNGLQNQDVLYVQDSLTAKPRVLVDPNLLSEDGTVALSEYAISRDSKHIAYSLAKGGSDWRVIRVKNVDTGEELPDSIGRVKFSAIAWYKNGFYYSRYPSTGRGEDLIGENKYQQVYYHKLGTTQEEDVLFYENKDNPERMYGAQVTEDERYLILTETESTYGSQLYLKVLDDKDGGFIPIATSFDYENAIVGSAENKLFLLTNKNAPRFKLQVVEVSGSGQISISDLIPEAADLLETATIAENKIVAKYLVDAHAEARLFDLNGTFLYNLEFPEYGDMEAFYGEYGESEAFYSFKSFVIPLTIFKYDLRKNRSEVFFKPKLDFNERDYEINLEFYHSKDSTRIPIYIVHKKGITLDGKNPTLLYGYGGFNISITPDFKTYLAVWLENGGIYASANIRGGGEYGEEWHKAGTKLMKQNVFDDFIAAAEYLIDKKFTSPERLAIEGRSNGGLLIGAVTNQRPDLFAVALPGVGVMDMLRFSKFTIGWAWESDYGSVNDSAEFRNLLAISPLHNIRPGLNYPAILAYTADRDDRVVPAHSFKYIATLQDTYKGANPILIRIQTEAGHGAGKSVSQTIGERADILAFTFYNMGINPFIR